MNKICWNITSKGLACVGQDEVIFLIETLPDETQIPKDVLIHINQIYMEATKGNLFYFKNLVSRKLILFDLVIINNYYFRKYNN